MIRRIGSASGVLIVGAAVGFGLAGCDFDFDRMIHQPSHRPYQESPRFDDGMSMRQPPPGAIARARILGPPALLEGQVDGRWTDDIPVEVSHQLIDRGRDRFHIFCAVCHGETGDGQSPVAAHMRLRSAPSLLETEIAGYPPGRLFGIVTSGYGLMPSYAEELSVRDRWAVVAFVRVLQLSQRMNIDDLTPELRKEAEPWLR